MKVALITDVFFRWGGGVDFLYTIYRGLEYRARTVGDIEVTLMIPKKVFPLDVCGDILRRIRKKCSPYEELLRVFQGKDNMIKIQQYDTLEIPQLGIYDKGRGLNKALEKGGFDICFPIANEEIDFRKIKIPYIAYIFDFQHKRLPELFPESVRIYRDKYFEYYVNHAQNIIVNAKDVVKDIKYYYPQSNSNVYNIPFLPIAKDGWIDLPESKIYDNYFMISNQFWAHKDHLTAFEALELLYQEGCTDIKMVCTGKMEDYRNPQYISMLKEKIESYKCKENIILLGYIDKEEQISIMKGARAVLQPTKFEGGPGGGSVYDAISLGVPCIVSDIAVNREIGERENVLYFKSGNSEDLKEIIKNFLKDNVTGSTEENVRKMQVENLKEYSDFFMTMMQKIIEKVK